MSAELIKKTRPEVLFFVTRRTGLVAFSFAETTEEDCVTTVTHVQLPAHVRRDK